MNPQAITKLLTKLWKHISPRRRCQFALLLILMILVSFAEILSIGAVLPFLAILTEPVKAFAYPSAQPFIHFMGFTDPKQLLLPLTFTFGLASIIAGLLRMLLIWASSRLSFAAGADLSIDIYRRTLYQPYAVHVERNSSEIIDGISSKTGSTIYVVSMSLNFISSIFILAFIVAALMTIDPVIAATTFGGFGLIYAFIIKFTRVRLLVNSQTIARESTNVIKSLQEGLGGIRDVLIDGSQATYCQIYRDADQPLRRAQANNTFINFSPRYAMEALGMLLIASIAYLLAYQDDGITKAIPVLGTLALGAQRLLPVLQQAYGSWSGIRGSQASLQDALELLEQPLPNYIDQTFSKPLLFNRQIVLKRLSFRYNSYTPWVLKNLDLCILKGARVGFIGRTGSGKSTLLDIVMGLLMPTEGELEIDGQTIDVENQRAWQAHIAHVPQAIYLADSTIEENIAFGLPKEQIDHQRIRHVAQQAQIADIIETWPLKYQTLVGERGIRLSGGQRQRIGIARALYKKADVIIFDEATSALDNVTEQSVMRVIESLGADLTLFIIAHRLTTLSNCTQIVELDHAEIVRVGSYHEIVSKLAAEIEVKSESL